MVFAPVLMEVEGGEDQEEEGARPGLQYGVAREVPGEEGT